MSVNGDIFLENYELKWSSPTDFFTNLLVAEAYASSHKKQAENYSQTCGKKIYHEFASFLLLLPVVGAILGVIERIAASIFGFLKKNSTNAEPASNSVVAVAESNPENPASLDGDRNEHQLAIVEGEGEGSESDDDTNQQVPVLGQDDVNHSLEPQPSENSAQPGVLSQEMPDDSEDRLLSDRDLNQVLPQPIISSPESENSPNIDAPISDDLVEINLNEEGSNSSIDEAVTNNPAEDVPPSAQNVTMQNLPDFFSTLF
jgi:hypothetical protein